MRETAKLGFREFLDDVRFIITSPGRRFAVIQERGVLWGSLLLLLAPAYFGFTWWGGIYFDRDPFPGYSFLVPLVPAAVLSLLKALGVHILARLFEGRGLFTRGKGRFRNLLVVFGYAGIPLIIALVAGLLVFVFLPSEIGTLLLGYRAVSLSLMISVSVGVFIWNLILMVLALRTVYSIRDLKLVAAILVGPPLATIPAMSMMFMVSEAKIDLDYARPLLADRLDRFFSAEAAASSSREPRIGLHVDHVVYRLKAPRRFDLVAYVGTAAEGAEKRKRRGGLLVSLGIFRASRHEGEETLGRVIGLPGEQVELSGGKVRLNGRDLDEPYLRPEFQASVSRPPKTPGSSEYYILPEDRRLVASIPNGLVVPGDRILGRALVRRWPFGWFWFRPNAFFAEEAQAAGN